MDNEFVILYDETFDDVEEFLYIYEFGYDQLNSANQLLKYNNLIYSDKQNRNDLRNVISFLHDIEMVFSTKKEQIKNKDLCKVLNNKLNNDLTGLLEKFL